VYRQNHHKHFRTVLVKCYTQKGRHLQPAAILLGTGVDNGGALFVLDGTALGAGSLERLHDIEGLLVSELAENNVTAVEPRSDDSGDKELRAVAMEMLA
jgi:hypothetical protein